MNKKKKNPVLKILFFLFIIYLALFIANISGYYENKIRRETLITTESINAFEEKIENGESVSIDSFLEKNNNDYSNKISRLGENISNGLLKILNNFFKYIVKITKSLF